MGRMGVCAFGGATTGTSGQISAFQLGVEPGYCVHVHEIHFSQYNRVGDANEIDCPMSLRLYTGAVAGHHSAAGYYIDAFYPLTDNAAPMTTAARGQDLTYPSGGTEYILARWNWRHRISLDFRFPPGRHITLGPGDRLLLSFDSANAATPLSFIGSVVIEEFGFGATKWSSTKRANRSIFAYFLTNDDLTANAPAGVAGNYNGISATRPWNRGKRYFEIQFHQNSQFNGGTSDDSVGLAVPEFWVGTWPGNTIATYGYSVGFGSDDVWFDGANLGIITPNPAWAADDWLRVAVDFDAGKIWFGKADAWYGDPAAGTGELATFTPPLTLVPVAVCEDTSASCTANFGASAFFHTIPSGFKAWDDPPD